MQYHHLLHEDLWVKKTSQALSVQADASLDGGDARPGAPKASARVYSEAAVSAPALKCSMYTYCSSIPHHDRNTTSAPDYPRVLS